MKNRLTGFPAFRDFARSILGDDVPDSELMPAYTDATRETGMADAGSGPLAKLFETFKTALLSAAADGHVSDADLARAWAPVRREVLRLVRRARRREREKCASATARLATALPAIAEVPGERVRHAFNQSMAAFAAVHAANPGHPLLGTLHQHFCSIHAR